MRSLILTPRHTFRCAIATITVAAVGAALAGCGGNHDAGSGPTTTIPAHVRLSGSLQLVDNAANYQFGGPCTGRGTAADVHAGASVVVRDAQNTVIGQGALQAGHADSNVECVFPFVVTELPLVDAYRIALGRYGAVTLSQQELTNARWNIHLGLATSGPTAGRLEVQQ
jgi:hypothetical protein